MSFRERFFLLSFGVSFIRGSTMPIVAIVSMLVYEMSLCMSPVHV